MKRFRIGRRLALGLLLLLPTRAGADFLHVEKIDEAAFHAAQQEGKRIVVAIGADWCPVCSLQGARLTRLAAEPAFRPLLVLHVDYDANRAFARGLGGSEQGTLIGFHGTRELVRVIGVVEMSALRAFLNQVLDAAP